MDDDEIEVVRQVYAAMAARDIERLQELIDPACVITQDERLPWGGRFVGHDGFLTFALALTGRDRLEGHHRGHVRGRR